MSGFNNRNWNALHAEHGAWLEVVAELRALGVGEINAGEQHERLHDLIVRWGEELAELRISDPNPANAERALEERRDKVAELDS